MRSSIRCLSLSLAVSVLAFGLTGCSNSVRRGSVLYADGRYIEAAEVFERNEYQLRNLSPSQQSEYGLYRALTFQALGDVANAQRWMTYAYDVERANPGSLTAERRVLLDRAWSDLARIKPAPMAAPPATALAASQPSPPIAAPALSPSSAAASQALVPQ